METFLNKRILVIFWMVLALHCVFQYFVLPYRAVTKPMLVPILLTYILLKDNNIGKPLGKSMFYIGLFLAFFGDVLLIIINDTFFLSGMIAFMLMNIFYSVSFLRLNKLNLLKSVSVLFCFLLLILLGCWFYHFLQDEMGDYKMPVMLYMVTVSIMTATAVNVAGNPKHRKVAVTYIIPGAIIFVIENLLVAFNRFHWDSNKNVYVLVMLSYGVAQYLLVRGILKVYPPSEPGNSTTVI